MAAAAAGGLSKNSKSPPPHSDLIRMDGGEAFLVNCGQSALNGS